MSAHGHWWHNKANARNKRDTSRHTHVPQPPPGRRSASEFPERDLTNAPSTAGCPVHEFKR